MLKTFLVPFDSLLASNLAANESPTIRLVGTLGGAFKTELYSGIDAAIDDPDASCDWSDLNLRKDIEYRTWSPVSLRFPGMTQCCKID